MSADDARYRITREALTALEAELHELETTARAEMAARIKTAREWGDLKENSEYHDAKNDQAHLETKIARLRDRINGAVVVESAAGGDRAGLGSEVTVRDEDSGRETTYRIVSASESDPLAGAIALDSPLGAALSGASEGDVVEFEAPRGTRRLRVVSL